jgi:hypothetical protein
MRSSPGESEPPQAVQVLVSPDVPDVALPGAKVSDQLEGWLSGSQQQTLGSLIDLFAEKGFAVIFVVLMAPSALPIPTGGVTNVLEVVTMLLALELIVGRRCVWLPQRWKRLDVGGRRREKFASALLRQVRWVERLSHPHLRFLFGHRLSGIIFGVVVLALTLAAFLAPPFSGLDTLPSLGIVLLALGVLLEDFLLAVAGFVIGALGALLVFVLGSRAVELVQQLL